jgi:hypothetical protein
MDILAGMLAYVAGIGALFAAVAVSFFVFFATPKEPAQMQDPAHGASAMLVHPGNAGAPSKTGAAVAHATHTAKESALHSEKRHAIAGSLGAVSPTASARERQRKPASAAQARQLTQGERARRWAYQQNPSFENRFLGYAD